MGIVITDHALERISQYSLTVELVISAIESPDRLLEGYSGRTVYQKRLNGYVLRVIVAEDKEIKRVITVYKAKSDRYEI